jgi:hypothetical protein
MEGPHGSLAVGTAHDPLVLALAELVRDRWRAEQEGPVEVLAQTRNMVSMTIGIPPQENVHEPAQGA